jgi:hypothetical protein
MRPVENAAPAANGTRVTYAFHGLTEWYENHPAGLEQGFTVLDRPSGTGALRIAGRFGGEAHARAVEHEGEDGARIERIDFTAPDGALVLRYAGLKAWDARGHGLPSELVLAGRELVIEVDDAHAAYPITVDPLVTSPSWTAESDQAAAQFGGAVATAGDVNGDGYSDAIVGASFFDGGELNEGRAYLFLGSPTGLATTPAWTAEPNQANSGFGAALGPAGDVNGDGFGDVVIGAFAYDNGQDNEGAAFVYLGSAAGLGPAPAWTAEGNQAQAFLGLSVGTAGDVNGDGFADVMVGISEFDNGESNEGRAAVFHGGAGGLSTTPAWTAESNQGGSNFGIAVASAGDVNGDGFGDVLAGAHLYDNGSVNEGEAFLYLGSAGGLATTPAWQKGADQDGALFGHALAGAGDVNGDGYADVVIGSELYDAGQTNEGRAFVFLGSATGLGATAAWTTEGNQAGATYGRFVATAGDVNGDGYADVGIGAPSFDAGEANEGRAVVFLGGAGGLATTPAWTAESDQADASFGTIGTAGDVNGDGFSDLIVGALAFDHGEADEGRAFAYHGGASGLATVPSWTRTESQAGAELGFAVAGAGDVNGDGYFDLLVGAPGIDAGGIHRGRALLFLGARTGPDSVPAWSADGAADSARFGQAVAGAGDLNGDGYSDVVIGAPGFTTGEPGEGLAFAYFGSAAGLGANAAWSASGAQAGAGFGGAVAGAGDLDGDGYAELVVGAAGYDSVAVDGGRVAVYFGSGSGVQASPGWIADGNEPGARLGASVASAGDVNRDGFSDLLVGVPGADGGGSDAGEVRVFLGAPTGPGTSPDWTAIGDQAGAELGSSVASAGDVNGDGFSDVLAGAPFFDGPLPDNGRALAYYGSASGPSAVPDWTQSGAHEGAHFGAAVTSAGDANADGLTEVAVGAPGDGPGGTPVSRVDLFLGSPAGLSGAASFGVSAAAAGARFGAAVASAGDLNADGFSDLVLGAPGWDATAVDAGAAYGFLGNGAAGGGAGVGLDRRPQQARANDLAPIDLLGRSDSPIAFRLRALGRSAAGRTRVRLGWEVAPLGTPLSGAPAAFGPRFDTGPPVPGVGSAAPTSQFIGGLPPQTVCHWRARLASDSPYFPHTPWLTPAMNGANEADFRTPEVLAVAQPEPAPGYAGLRLDPAAPNPFGARTEIVFALSDPGNIRLRVYDVSGREVARLADERLPAGRHLRSWDGRGARGQQVASGIYFLRLEHAGRVTSRKVVLAR